MDVYVVYTERETLEGAMRMIVATCATREIAVSVVKHEKAHLQMRQVTGMNLIIEKFWMELPEIH